MQQQVEREHGAEHRSPWDPEVERRRQPAGHGPHPAATPAAGLHGPGGALTPDMQHPLGQMFGRDSCRPRRRRRRRRRRRQPAKPKILAFIPGRGPDRHLRRLWLRSKRDTTQGVVLHRNCSSSIRTR